MTIPELLEKLKEVLDNVEDYTIDYGCQIYEHAAGKREVLQGIRNSSRQTIRHIIKTIQFGKEHSDTLRHWASDIYGFLSEEVYVKIKKQNRFANKQELKTCLFEEKYDNEQAIRASYNKAKLADSYSIDGYKNPQYTDMNILKDEVEKVVDRLIELIITDNLDTNTVLPILQEAAGL